MGKAFIPLAGMRKVTQLSVQAFLDGRLLKSSNTSAEGDTLKLHGNVIVKKVYPHGRDWCNGDWEISLCDWNTMSTRERLNGFLRLANIPLNIRTKNGKIYLKHWHYKTLYPIDADTYYNPLVIAMEIEMEGETD